MDISEVSIKELVNIAEDIDLMDKSGLIKSDDYVAQKALMLATLVKERFRDAI